MTSTASQRDHPASKIVLGATAVLWDEGGGHDEPHDSRRSQATRFEVASKDSTLRRFMVNNSNGEAASGFVLFGRPTN